MVRNNCPCNYFACYRLFRTETEKKIVILVTNVIHLIELEIGGTKIKPVQGYPK
jgi:hypothetical protein